MHDVLGCTRDVGSMIHSSGTIISRSIGISCQHEEPCTLDPLSLSQGHSRTDRRRQEAGDRRYETGDGDHRRHRPVRGNIMIHDGRENKEK